MTDEERAHAQEVGWNAALTMVLRFGAMLPDYRDIKMGDLRIYIEGIKK